MCLYLRQLLCRQPAAFMGFTEGRQHTADSTQQAAPHSFLPRSVLPPPPPITRGLQQEYPALFSIQRLL